MKAGPTGSLFGSVTATDIADELWEKHKVRVDRRKIELPQPIKHVGRYAIAGRDLRGGPAPRWRRSWSASCPKAASYRPRSWTPRRSRRRRERGRVIADATPRTSVRRRRGAGRGSARRAGGERGGRRRGTPLAESPRRKPTGLSRLIHKPCGGLWNIARTFRVERPFRPPCRPDSRRQLRERMFCSACKCRASEPGGEAWIAPLSTR